MRKLLRRNGKRLASGAVVALMGIVGAVVVPSPAQADWVRDFNGDGRGDLTMLFDGGNASASLWMFAGQLPAVPGPGPGQTSPRLIWATAANTYSLASTKAVGGDFTGDGRKDVIFMYDYGNGSAGVFVIPGTVPLAGEEYRVWFVPQGHLFLQRAKLAAGDFNGDGFDDLLMLYDRGNNRIELFVWPGTAARGDGASQLYSVYFSPPGSFSLSDMEITAGDFNGDGRDDLVALYDYPDSSNPVGLFVFPGVSAGNTTPRRVWHRTGLQPHINRRAQLTTTNWDLDNKDDLFILTGGNVLYLLPGTDQVGDQAVQASALAFQSIETIVLSRSRIASANYDGSGRGELMGMYDVGDGRTAMWVFNGSLLDLLHYRLDAVWVGQQGAFPLNRSSVTS